MNPIAKLTLLTVVVAANIAVAAPPPRGIGAGISCSLSFKRDINTGDPIVGSRLIAVCKGDGLQAPPAIPRHLGRHGVRELQLGATGRVPKFSGSKFSFEDLRYHNNLSTVLFSGRALPQLGNLSKLHYLNLSPSNDDYLHLSDSVEQMESTDISWFSRLSLLRLLDMIRFD